MRNLERAFERVVNEDNSSSSNIDNWQQDFLVLGVGPTNGVNNSNGTVKKD